MFIAAGGRTYPSPYVPSFPLKVSGNGRYLVDSNHVPFPLLNYALWPVTCMTPTDITSLITKLQSFGVTAVHIIGVNTPDNNGNTCPDDAGNLPWLKNTSGGTYTAAPPGSGDVSQYNTTYWNRLQTKIQQFRNAGIAVLMHAVYLGYYPSGAITQGIAADLNASGSTKCTTFGTYIGGTLTPDIWMPYGDCNPAGAAASTYSNLDTCHAAFWNACLAASSVTLVGGHYPVSNGRPTSSDNTDTAGSPVMKTVANVNTIYAYPSNGYTPDNEFSVQTFTLAGSQQTPVVPNLKFDDAMYENDGNVTGIDVTANGTRKRHWWALLTGTCGAGWGNELCNACGSPNGAAGSFTYANMNVSTGLQSDGHKHLGIATQIYTALPWYLLNPENVGSSGTIVTSGQSSTGTQSWIASALAVDGSCLVAYVPPAVAALATITVAANNMAGTYRAMWVDPTTATITKIGDFSPGSRSFTTPSGTNAYGQTDWLLVLLSPNRKIWN